MKRIRIRSFIVLILIFGLIYFSRNIAFFFTDWMWFDSIGQADVFTTIYAARLAIGLAVGLCVSGLIFINGWSALKAVANEPINLPGQLAGSPLEQILRKSNLKLPVAIVSLLLGTLIGFAGQNMWEAFILAFYGGEFQYTDPILGTNAAFYVFKLPVITLILDLLNVTLVLSAIVASVLYFIRGAIGVQMKEIDGRFVPSSAHALPGARRHIGLLLSVWLVLQAIGAVLARYMVMFDQSGLIAGPGYADHFGTLPALWVKAGAMLIAAVLVGIGMSRMNLKLLITGALMVAAGWALARFVPSVIQQVSVVPNEINREKAYIENHIAGTQFAFELGKTDERKLSGKASLDMNDIQNNQGTIQNIRLWDHSPLLDTFKMNQEIRTYYGFSSVDNDRYMIDGQLRQIMLSPREVTTSELETRARTWINESFKYTHGYGIALGPVNEKKADGGPLLFIKDLPPKISYPNDLDIDQPALYFGETMDNPVFVATNNLEFDYPSGEGDKETTYSGLGGIGVGSLFHKVLVALRLGSAKVILTGDFNPDSRVLLYRNIKRRVNRVAPFLHLDHDPYLVIADGRLVWIVDAYTIAYQFPYSISLAQNGPNYMRNSVKVAIDAYDGSMAFYQMNDDDPIINAWSEVFPGLLRDQSEMPDALKAHIRYPVDYFSVQAHLYATYHMTDPNDFYKREDQWEVPIINGRKMVPYYTVMKIPGEESEEFILMLPFVPKDRPNLAAWMVARADGEHYGQTLAYTFPKESKVDGPQIIVARINQDDTISEKLTLWGQQGSDVEMGTLMVIPIEKSLIYVMPVILRANTNPVPELRRVVVAYGDEIEWAETLDGALEEIFGSKTNIPQIDIDQNPAAISSTPTDASDSSKPLTAQARQAYLNATQAAQNGDWAAYGTHIQELGQLLEELATPASVPTDDEGSNPAPTEETVNDTDASP